MHQQQKQARKGFTLTAQNRPAINTGTMHRFLSQDPLAVRSLITKQLKTLLQQPMKRRTQQFSKIPQQYSQHHRSETTDRVKGRVVDDERETTSRSQCTTEVEKDNTSVRATKKESVSANVLCSTMDNKHLPNAHREEIPRNDMKVTVDPCSSNQKLQHSGRSTNSSNDKMDCVDKGKTQNEATQHSSASPMQRKDNQKANNDNGDDLVDQNKDCSCSLRSRKKNVPFWYPAVFRLNTWETWVPRRRLCLSTSLPVVERLEEKACSGNVVKS